MLPVTVTPNERMNERSALIVDSSGLGRGDRKSSKEEKKAFSNECVGRGESEREKGANFGGLSLPNINTGMWSKCKKKKTNNAQEENTLHSARKPSQYVLWCECVYWFLLNTL